MLAEGFGVYLQDEIGGNTGYPNFGKDVHKMMRCEFTADRKRINLSSLDSIPTPIPLTIDFSEFSEREKGRWSYIFAGSFVRHLIGIYGMDKFRALYAQTPFKPKRHVARQSRHWSNVYGVSLALLEQGWKSMIEAVNCTS